VTELLLQQEGGILTLTLNRPQALNALTASVLDQLAAALLDANHPSVRVVVLRGAGRGFCAGQDLGEWNGAITPSFREHLIHYNRVIEALVHLPRPVVAAVQGVAAGAGLSLALACDLRVASSQAFFTTGFSKIGLVPDSGMTYTLPRLIGWGRAAEWMLTSRRIDASEAFQLGLVSQVWEPEVFEGELERLTSGLAQGPTQSFALIKQGLRHSATASLSEVLENESLLQEMAGQTHDHHEGVKAFREKRLPQYEGR
jgi:2-(1,2-epoxy-1,2-dihydrophenyl)acetyl-CoA isomerase